MAKVFLTTDDWDVVSVGKAPRENLFVCLIVRHEGKGKEEKEATDVFARREFVDVIQEILQHCPGLRLEGL